MWSPDSSRLAYMADQDTDNVIELFVASATGGASTKVNGALVASGDERASFVWSPLGMP